MFGSQVVKTHTLLQNVAGPFRFVLTGPTEDGQRERQVQEVVRVSPGGIIGSVEGERVPSLPSDEGILTQEEAVTRKKADCA